MNQYISHRQVDLAAIDLSDRSFAFSPVAEPPSAELIESIRQFGILHPPLLLEKGPAAYIIITGRKRIEAACSMPEFKTIRCLVIEAYTPELFIFSILLEEWIYSGMPSTACQVSFLSRFLEQHPPEKALPLLAKLGHKPNRHTLDNLLTLRRLHPSGLAALHKGLLNTNNARSLLELPAPDQQTLVELIEIYRLGGSKQQKLISYGTELIRRSNSSMADIIAPLDAGLQQDGPENIPQKAGTLLKLLHERCFPSMTGAKEQFDRKASRLDLPKNMEINHTPSFEDDTLTLSIRLADWQELENMLTGLKQIRGRIESP